MSKTKIKYKSFFKDIQKYKFTISSNSWKYYELIPYYNRYRFYTLL